MAQHDPEVADRLREDIGRRWRGWVVAYGLQSGQGWRAAAFSGAPPSIVCRLADRETKAIAENGTNWLGAARFFFCSQRDVHA
jgi:hypothetical protein